MSRNIQGPYQGFDDNNHGKSNITDFANSGISGTSAQSQNSQLTRS